MPLTRSDVYQALAIRQKGAELERHLDESWWRPAFALRTLHGLEEARQVKTSRRPALPPPGSPVEQRVERSEGHAGSRRSR
jgi:hypothetical protein